jgi:hypothetical protein
MTRSMLIALATAGAIAAGALGYGLLGDSQVSTITRPGVVHRAWGWPDGVLQDLGVIRCREADVAVQRQALEDSELEVEQLGGAVYGHVRECGIPRTDAGVSPLPFRWLTAAGSDELADRGIDVLEQTVRVVPFIDGFARREVWLSKGPRASGSILIADAPRSYAPHECVCGAGCIERARALDGGWGKWRRVVPGAVCSPSSATQCAAPDAGPCVPHPCAELMGIPLDVPEECK